MTLATRVVIASIACIACAPPVTSAEPVAPALPREFRGVWIASVGNMDWPSRRGLSTEAQQAELIAILDKVRALRMNAVILQVRPGGDALYASRLEPWSEYLTGTMGQAPEPFYDPLQFAIEQAHLRGLELHAWFNPYRARHPSGRSAVAASHISRTRPQVVHRYGTHMWMDPAEPAVQQHALKVILDVVSRYDVDGVHIDDYFYPYQERDARNRLIPFPDDASWQRYVRRGGKLSRPDWRRSNVDTFVQQLYTQVKAARPEVKVGISPFGIWRPGHPRQVQGLDAYTELFADARKWLNHGWLDYMAPQLYWRLDAPQQSYADLLNWWVGENVKSRHIWPGNAAYRVRADRQNWAADEIVEQIQATRSNVGATGNVLFNMTALMRNQGGLADLLERNAYPGFALTPRTPWLDATPPPAPTLAFNADHRQLTLVPGANSDARWFAVQLLVDGTWYSDVVGANVGVYDLPRSLGRVPELVSVTAVDRNGNESGPASLHLR